MRTILIQKLVERTFVNSNKEEKFYTVFDEISQEDIIIGVGKFFFLDIDICEQEIYIFNCCAHKRHKNLTVYSDLIIPPDIELKILKEEYSEYFI